MAGDKKTKTSMPFIRAYTFILEKKDLIPAEKLVLMSLCRYWPSPFWGSNSSVALSLGYTARYVQRIISRLKAKGYIKAGYAHKIQDGENYTVRLIVPMCFEGKCRLSDFKIDHDLQVVGGNGPEDRSPAAYSTQADGLQDDLLERNRKNNIKLMSLPLPGEEQAKTLASDIAQGSAAPIVRNYSQILKGTLYRATAMTQDEFEQRRQKQLSRLRVM
ncbi:MAG: hypothetical protein PHP01_08360 [Phycisphaerae bacterium]|nr:hypothetical protein [Phycisphaerae bacterium]